MPTFSLTPRFRRAHAKLTRAQRDRFREVVKTQFVPDLRTGLFRPRLRVKRIDAVPGLYEVTWALDGRATWAFGEAVRPGEPHVIWHMIGTHVIFEPGIVKPAATSEKGSRWRKARDTPLIDP